ncbi:hypothetical protein FNO01nite_34790 [Flavobacterium noncentrifugens]|uniref:Uncharacterized protein n=1 Tax=Flavobacterium noncentrifugens TaxID=1128970 RepID=A0A1G9DFR2_9FLAO|nr:hypothetical protein [Flavobacterium noncentrifugens]GEP52807.1 hypothetical protein FNO01nite_34790 [Flavobacterium noncentrifugens]SDK62680.1 hypothetical protein SAMN04487935_3806 [Flavobacterium noncentrifugens]
MKNLLVIFIVVIAFTQSCFSQEKYDWNTIQKVELYSFEKNNKCGEINSKNLNFKTLVKGETTNIIKYLKEFKTNNLDILLEQTCYALRIYFPKYHTDFIYFPSQGVLFRMKNGNKYFWIEKREEFNKLIDDLTRKNGL